MNIRKSYSIRVKRHLQNEFESFLKSIDVQLLSSIPLKHTTWFDFKATKQQIIAIDHWCDSNMGGAKK